MPAPRLRRPNGAADRKPHPPGREAEPLGRAFPGGAWERGAAAPAVLRVSPPIPASTRLCALTSFTHLTYSRIILTRTEAPALPALPSPPAASPVEVQSVHKRGKDRGRIWLTSSPWLLVLLLLAVGAFWFFNREPSSITLHYGQLKQILEAPAPGVSFQNVKVGRTEIRGEIKTTDPESDGEHDGKSVVVKPFRTSRIGFEGDTRMLELLNERVGPNHQGEEEESAFKGVYSLLM